MAAVWVTLLQTLVSVKNSKIEIKDQDFDKFCGLFFTKTLSFNLFYLLFLMSVHRGNRGGGGPADPQQQQPQTTTISHANCRKV